MVVDDFNLARTVTIDPNKTDAPLIVDANAVLPGSVSLKRLQARSWERCKITERFGTLKILESPFSLGLKTRERSNKHSIGEFLRSSIPILPRHERNTLIILRDTYNVHTQLLIFITFAIIAEGSYAQFPVRW